MTPRYFFLWGYVKERAYVPPLPADFDELTNRITAAVNSVTEDTLRRFLRPSSGALGTIVAASGVLHEKG